MARHQHRQDLRVRQMHPVLVARRGLEVEAEAIATAERHPAFLEAPDPQLGPLQVSHRADGAAARGFHLAHEREAGGVLLVAAMAEVEAEDIHARLGKVRDALPARACGTQRRHDLPAAVATHRVPPARSSSPSLAGHPYQPAAAAAGKTT
jgi:hypothetical protein